MREKDQKIWDEKKRQNQQYNWIKDLFVASIRWDQEAPIQTPCVIKNRTIMRGNRMLWDKILPNGGGGGGGGGGRIYIFTIAVAYIRDRNSLHCTFVR